MRLIYCLLLCSLLSCSNEAEELRDKVAKLEKQLDECQNGEDKIIGILKNSNSNKDYNSVISQYEILKSKFPSSSFISQANQMAENAKVELLKIKESEEKLKAEEIEKKKASLKKLSRNYDDVSGNTWYNQKYFTHYTNSNRVSLELGHRAGSTPWLILFMSYTGDDWIFFENAYLSYDGNTKEIFFDDYENKKTENGSGGVWEWIKIEIKDDMIDWLESFAKSKNAKMRLSGKYEKTRTLTSQERQGLLDVIAGYRFLKENPQTK